MLLFKEFTNHVGCPTFIENLWILPHTEDHFEAILIISEILKTTLKDSWMTDFWYQHWMITAKEDKLSIRSVSIYMYMQDIKLHDCTSH